MEDERRKEITVQGFGTPVPAAFGSERAGSRSSRSCDRNATVVDSNLATGADMLQVTRRNSIALEDKDPFRRSSTILRSPPQAPKPEEGKSTNGAGNGRTEKNSANSTEHRKGHGQTPDEDDPRIAMLTAKVQETEKLLMEMSETLNALFEFADPKHNVHRHIKTTVRALRGGCKKALEGLRSTSQGVKVKPAQGEVSKTGAPRQSTPNSMERATQTSPVWKRSKGEKRVREGADEVIARLPTPKKQKSVKEREASLPAPKSQTSANEGEGGKPINPKALTSSKPLSGHEKQVQKKDDRGWTTVRQKRRKERKRKPRPDAILIAKKGDLSYADILRKVKGDAELKDLGDSVTKIRRTQKGDLLLELNGAAEERTLRFQNLVENTLGQEASVRSYTHEIEIECRDLDEVTTKEDIRRALSEQFQLADLKDTAIKRLRKAYGGTQTAAISLPVEWANKVLAVGKIKIGWVICRLREKVSPTRCFRCLEYGHLARSCKSEWDRSDQCRRCGEKGHLAKNCKKDPECMLCKSVGSDDRGHIAGSSRCPLFQRALGSMRR